MYDHILFDADNTLLDFDKAQFFGFKTVLEYYGCAFSKKNYEQYETINHALWNQFEQGIIDKDTVQEKRFSEFFGALGMEVDGVIANGVYQKALCKQSWLIPYAEEICKELFPYIPLSIVTNGVGHTQTERISNSAINKYMSHVIISESIGYAKPSKKFFEETFSIIGRKNTDRIMIVGDSISSDIQGGIIAGIDTCWYNPKGLILPEDVKVNSIISDLRDLKEIALP